jgi:ribonuclease H2 subunit C
MYESVKSRYFIVIARLTMLAIEKSKSHRGKCTPNVLPCRINHNGPVDASKRYWNPTKTAGTKSFTDERVFYTNVSLDGKTVAYFRGRKLYGKQLKVPKGYRGVVVSSTDRVLPKLKPTVDDDEEAEEDPDVKIIEEQSEFDDVMLWGHEALPDDSADPYVRGMEEWIAFAEQVCALNFEGVEADSYRFIPVRTKRTTRWRRAKSMGLWRSGWKLGMAFVIPG